jgi:hypothetical protein
MRKQAKFPGLVGGGKRKRGPTVGPPVGSVVVNPDDPFKVRLPEAIVGPALPVPRPPRKRTALPALGALTQRAPKAGALSPVGAPAGRSVRAPRVPKPAPKPAAAAKAGKPMAPAAPAPKPAAAPRTLVVVVVVDEQGRMVSARSMEAKPTGASVPWATVQELLKGPAGFPPVNTP